MAGYDIDAINAAIRPIADLALIGDSDLGETADKMTNIMTTFQIAPDRMREAANIMATTATRSNTDLMMLAESAKYGGGVANMYGRNDPNLLQIQWHCLVSWVMPVSRLHLPVPRFV